MRVLVGPALVALLGTGALLSEAQRQPSPSRYLPAGDYTHGLSPRQLCASLEQESSAECSPGLPPAAPVDDRLCIYDAYCLDDLPRIVRARVQLPASLQTAQYVRSSSLSPLLRRVDVPMQSSSGQAGDVVHELRYRGPTFGRQAGLRFALGIAGQVLSNTARDGGWNIDSRNSADELDSFRSNLNLRIEALQGDARAKAERMAAFVPAASNTYAIHAVGIGRFDPPVSAAASRLRESRLRAEALARERSSATLLLSAADDPLSGLKPSVVRNRIRVRLPEGAMRPGGLSVAGLNDDLRAEEYGGGSIAAQSVARESHKLRLALAEGRGNASSRARDEVAYDAAAAMAIAKVRLAALLADDDGNASVVRSLVQDAQSARYYLQGSVAGVIDRQLTGTDLVLTSDPRTMAGTMWATVLSEASTQPEFGDWGLPALSLTFRDAPPSVVVSSEPPIPAPQLPGGATVDDNVREAILYLHAEAFFQQEPRIFTQEVMRFGMFIWFKDQVNDGRPWDYKLKGPEYEYAGNFNYGATGAALGISLDLLQRAAGYVQVRNGRSKPEWNTPNREWPHGDQPEDQLAIEDGFKYYWQHTADWDAWRARLRGRPLR